MDSSFTTKNHVVSFLQITQTQANQNKYMRERLDLAPPEIVPN